MAVTKIAVLHIEVPAGTLNAKGEIDLTVGPGGDVVSISGDRYFVLEGADYEQTCAALLKAGFTTHDRVLDAISEAAHAQP